MFNWDGSELTDIFNEDTTIEEGIYDKSVYWRIEKDEKEEFCIIRLSPTLFPCLIDELKPIFKLEKNGTHWIKYKGKKYILLKVMYKNGTILKELTLDKIEHKESLQYEVQKIFIFRELLGLSQNFEKCIILREIGQFIIPISFYETNMVPSGEKKVIPETIIEKWFKNITLDEAVSKLFRIKDAKDITDLSFKLRGEMETIFNRVDKDLIMNMDEILQRIVLRLQHILN
jgi:hypothetical protein